VLQKITQNLYNQTSEAVSDTEVNDVDFEEVK